MSQDALIKTWLPLFFVIIAEHFVLTYIYKKPSSLARLCKNPNASAKTDMAVWFFYYVVLKHVKLVATFFVIPGIAAITLSHLIRWYDWTGLLGISMPENRILQVIIWLLAIDFSVYLAHIAMHKVPFLWSFHKLHHAATELNIVTGTRRSLSEYFLNTVFIFMLWTILLGFINPGVYLTVILLRRIIDLLQHSDLPWDYGIFGYVIASPRFHRLHHSRERADLDSNYGNIFSLWDSLFATVAPRYRASTQVADMCSLGLTTDEETDAMNRRWYLAIFYDSLPNIMWSIWKDFLDRTGRDAESDRVL